MMHDNTTHRSRIITSGQDLCDLLVSHARREAMYPPCILDLTEQVLNHLAEDGDMEDLIEEDLSPFRQLANAVSRDISERAELRIYNSALVEFAMRVLDGRVWCPVVELARVLGFDKDGLAYQDVSGSWFVVSTPRFEQETGFAVRSWGGTFAIGLPVMPEDTSSWI